MPKPMIEIYSKKGCDMCKDAKDLIGKVNRDLPFQYREVDINSNKDLKRRFSEDVPTVFINGKKAFKFRVNEDEFRKKVRKEIIKDGIIRVKNKSKLVT